MRETLWDYRQIRNQREEMAQEIEEIRLARSLRSKEGRLRGLVAVLFGELSQGAGKACEKTSPTTLA
jgi:hypothetical protein